MKAAASVKVSLDAECFILDAISLRSQPWICLSTSERQLRLYDSAKMSFVRSLQGHTRPITDIRHYHDTLYSCQNDTGVMISDLRTQQPVRFLDELTSSGADCSSIDVSPDGNTLAISIGMTVQLVETRTFTTSKILHDVHSDDISKIRFIDNQCFVSGSEDQMVNFIDTAVKDSESLLTSFSIQEALTRVEIFPPMLQPGSTWSRHRTVCAVGTMENLHCFPVPGDMRNDDFENEVVVKRPSATTYGVDCVMYNNVAYAVMGQRPEFDDNDDDNVGDSSSAQPSSLVLRPLSHESATVVLPAIHTGVVRAACVVDNRLITVGEDSQMVAWAPAPSAADNQDGSEGASSQSGKEKTTAKRVKRTTFGNRA